MSEAGWPFRIGWCRRWISSGALAAGGAGRCVTPSCLADVWRIGGVGPALRQLSDGRVRVLEVGGESAVCRKLSRVRLSADKRLVDDGQSRATDLVVAE